MMSAAIDIHKRVFQAAVLEPESGALEEQRVPATRELQARGFDVRLADRREARARQGSKRRPKSDRLDARWLCLLLAKQLLPES